MKKLIFLLIAICGLGFTSCEKDLTEDVESNEIIFDNKPFKPGVIVDKLNIPQGDKTSNK